MAAEMETEGRMVRMTPVGRRLVLLPMPFQGHINPMFQLATLLFNRGFSITVVHTRFNAPDPTNYPSFRFVPIDERPGKPHSAYDNIAKVIAINDGYRESFRDRLMALLEEAEREGEEPVACLVADALFYWTKAVAEELGVRRVVLRTSSAAALRLFRAFPKLWEKGYSTVQEKISVMASSVTFAPKVDMSGMPEKFSGQFFKRWQHRMRIWLTTIGLVSLLEMDCPILDQMDPESVKRVEEWNERDKICQGCVLLTLSDALFDVYSSSTFDTTKVLWEELDKKYNTEDLGIEKYSVGRFLKFQMVEGKSVSEQAYELLLLLYGLVEAQMKLPEKFQVMSIVEKFLKSWVDFRMSLKHRKGQISLDDLMRAIVIEKEHRKEKPSMSIEVSANFVTGRKGKDPKGKGKTSNDPLKVQGKIKKKKKKENCYECGQKGHFAKECPKNLEKKAKRAQLAAAQISQVNTVTVGNPSSDGPFMTGL